MLPLAASLLTALVARTATLHAQDAAQTGTIAGTVLDERGAPVADAQVYLERPVISTTSRPNGAYVLIRVPAGPVTVRARMLGFQPDSARVTVPPDERVVVGFTLRRDPLRLQAIIVTGTPFRARTSTRVWP